jgi:hypothetical protein
MKKAKCGSVCDSALFLGCHAFEDTLLWIIVKPQREGGFVFFFPSSSKALAWCITRQVTLVEWG